MAKARRGLQGGMVIVGHESPHKFDAPSLDYLRSGQGANSYSGGIYNWESPGVGRNYHDEFTRKIEATDPSLRAWNKAHRARVNYEQWLERNNNWAAGGLDHYFTTDPSMVWGGRSLIAPEQIEELRSLRQQILKDNEARTNFGMDLSNISTSGYRTTYKDTWTPSIPYYERMYEMLPAESRNKITNIHDPMLKTTGIPVDTKENWAAAMSLLYPHYDDYDTWTNRRVPPTVGPKPQAPPAFTYQFNLNTPRENFVEFQRPIRNQRGWLRDALMDVVQEANDTVYADGEKHFGEWNRPEEIYDLLKEYRPPNAGDLIDGRRIPNRYRDSSAHPNLGEFESALVDRGIPGVRYPDQYSRDLPEISPSRTENFVVYDPSIMELVKRYPYSLLAPALLAEGAREKQTPVQSPLAGSLLQ
jgi:hypothetical protein